MLGRTARALIVLATTGLIMGLVPGAWACSCARMGDAHHFERAEVVFVGTAGDHRDPREGEPIRGSGDRIVWRFDVGSVQKGRIEDPAEVASSRDEASCGFTFVEGGRYQVFASRDGDGLSTGLCSGTRDLAQQAAYRPAGASGTVAPASTEAAAPHSGEQPALPVGGAGRVGLAVPGLLVAAAAVAVLLLSRRAARGRPPRIPS